jgi:hypothetical protein
VAKAESKPKQDQKKTTRRRPAATDGAALEHAEALHALAAQRLALTSSGSCGEGRKK